MLSFYDYLVIGFYFLFMIGIGVFFRRFTKNSSEYFRGGGQMTWWLVSGSAFMASFSAWTFTGAAGIAYQCGLVIMVIYFSNAIGFLLNFTHFAPWFRQMRVISVMQGVRARFGSGSEQFFTWFQLPVQLMYAGIWLFGLAIFFSSVFKMNLPGTIVVTGLAVLVIATIGGSWAVVAGDFLQALILMPITFIAAFLALREVGGVHALLEKVPASHLDLTGSTFAEYGWLWVIAMVVNKIFVLNNMQDAARYLCVKDGVAARKAALMSAILFIIGPIVWFIPPLAARVVYPDLSQIFPSLQRPEEGAYVAIALKTMPAGLIGLLVTGIFASTMSAMDTGLNRNAGIFVKSVYQPLFRPHASERELVLIGKSTSIVMGLLVILIALVYSSWKNLGLFKLMLNFTALVGIPYSIALLWCLVIKKTPPWSGWSTVLVSLLASLVVSNGPSWHWLQALFAVGHLEGILTWAQAHDFVAANTVIIGVGSTWFFLTTFFYDRCTPAYKKQVENFFRQLHRPVDFEQEIGEESDQRQANALSFLCLAYGGFVALLVFIPNPLLGRACIFFCAFCLIAVGCMLRQASKKNAAAALKAQPVVSMQENTPDALKPTFKRSMGKKRTIDTAFTLMELLVTISIVLILATLAVAGGKLALQSAKSAKCVGNMRQIGVAMRSYLENNNDLLPQRFYGSINNSRFGYTDLLLPYCHDDGRIFKCPSQPLNNYPVQPSYGMNWYLDNASVNILSTLSQTIMIAETRGPSGVGSRRADRNSVSPGQLDTKRHGNRANYLFFDGHVESLTWEETVAPLDKWGTDFGRHTPLQ